MRGRPPATPRWPYQLGLGLAVLASSVVVLLLVALSPLALQGIVDYGADWRVLSEVGQAYGAVSALLSALALCGVALSLLLQWRQTRMSQIITARERQFELIQLGLHNPDLIYVRIRGIPDADLPKIQYAHLWVSHWKMLWDLRLVREPEISHLALELFGNDVAYAWWEKVGPHWNISRSRRSRQFMKILMEAHQLISEMYKPTTAGNGDTDLHVPAQRSPLDEPHAAQTTHD
jgi:hypothetical protein